MASFDSRFVANSFLTDGLTAFNTVEGLGLITHGFLWPSEGIWSIPIGEDIPSTAWLVPASEAAPTTIWAVPSSEIVPTTGWTNAPDCSVNGFY